MTRKEPQHKINARVAKARAKATANGWCYMQLKVPLHLKQQVRDMVAEYVKRETT